MDLRDKAKPLPSHLIERYKGWRATRYSENESWFTHLAEHGQNPRAMIISCCDSRLHITNMFGADTGEIFIHRNIANLVPPFSDDNGLHGTSAAIEFAVCALNVANLIVIGHSQCGGIEGAYKMCHENEKSETVFLGPWLELMRPGYEAVADKAAERGEALRQMEQQSVVISLQNLMSFPFVADAVNNKKLALHGLWNDIGKGLLHQYDAQKDRFEVIE